MTTVNRIEKKVQMKVNDIIKYQILTYCYLNSVSISEADLACLTLLAIEGEQELTVFCAEVYKKNIFQSPQTVRNALSKAEKKKLIIKEGRSKKRISINPILSIQTTGNILLDYKFLALAT